MPAPFLDNLQQQPQLRLEKFRQIESELLGWWRLVPGVQQILRLILLRVEEAYLEQLVRDTVTAAIEGYEANEEKPTDLIDRVTVSESPSEVEGLFDLRMSSTIPGLKPDDL